MNDEQLFVGGGGVCTKFDMSTSDGSLFVCIVLHLHLHVHLDVLVVLCMQCTRTGSAGHYSNRLPLY
jgi:hypothetical protein